MYSQLYSSKRNVGGPFIRYKDKLKSNLEVVRVPHAFQQMLLEQKEWRVWYDGIKVFKLRHHQHLRETTVRTKQSALRPSAHNFLPRVDLVHKYLVGMKCYI